MATPATPPAARSQVEAAQAPSIVLSVTDLANFIHLRRCGRFLALGGFKAPAAVASGPSSAPGPAHARCDRPLDPELARSGHDLEHVVAAELLSRASRAPRSHPPQGSSTPWSEFWAQVTTLPPPPAPCSLAGSSNSSNSRNGENGENRRGQAPPAVQVGYWASEVALQGRPTPDAAAHLSGRADFLMLLWRRRGAGTSGGGSGGASGGSSSGNSGGTIWVPVLRLVECKASREPQTKYLAQLVAYRMLLLRLLEQEAGRAPARGAGGASGGGSANGSRSRVLIGGRWWALPHSVGSSSSCVDGSSSSSGCSSGGADELEIECVLRINGGAEDSGAGGGDEDDGTDAREGGEEEGVAAGAAAHTARQDVVDAEPLPRREVESITRQLASLLAPLSGRVAVALETPLQEVPYELGSHCVSCPRSPACWSDAAARGALQLSGCGADTAQALRLAGVADIEDLASLRPPPLQPQQQSPQPQPHQATTRLQQVAEQVGLSRPELYRLSLTAQVRAARWLPQAASAVGAAVTAATADLEALSTAIPQQSRRSSLAPPFLLLPGSGPSCLPARAPWPFTDRHEKQRLQPPPPLVRLYLTVATDPILCRVVGVAAHVAAADGTETSEAWWRPPPQLEQRGWDVVELITRAPSQSAEGPQGAAEGLVKGKEGHAADARGAEADSDVWGSWDEAEAALLERFSTQVCAALEEAAASLAPPSAGSATHQPPQPLLHVYVHSQSELQSLVRRCSALDHMTAGSGGGGASGAATPSNRHSSSGRGSGCGGVGGDGGSSGGGRLAWLPHLLGLRAGLPGEQLVSSALEEEVRRYATPWQGGGLLAACAVDWGAQEQHQPQQPPQPQPQAQQPPPHNRSRADNGGLYQWRAPAFLVDAGAASGGACAGDVDLQAVFSPGGCLSAIVPIHPELHGALQQQEQQTAAAGATGAAIGAAGPPQQRQPQGRPRQIPSSASAGIAGSHVPLLVQVQPDLPGGSIPPAFIRALWHSAAATANPAAAQQDDASRAAHVHDNGKDKSAGCAGGGGVFAAGARHLRALLAARAHAVRWLEERLVRLPGGGRIAITNSKLDNPLPLPLSPQLRHFRLHAGAAPAALMEGPTGLRESVASAVTERSAAAVAVALAATDAVRLNRGAEVRQFWRQLAAAPPAARAEGGRGCAVLGDLRAVPQGKYSTKVLRGRVLYPPLNAADAADGSRDAARVLADAFSELTGLKDKDGVVVSKVAAVPAAAGPGGGSAGAAAALVPDPWLCQSEEQVMNHFALHALKLLPERPEGGGGDGGGDGDGDGDGGGLWVELHYNYVSKELDPEDFFVAGPNTAARFAEWAGGMVALDAAPNIAALVATSCVEGLQEAAADSAYVARRLRLPSPPPRLRAGRRPCRPPPLQQAQQQAAAAGGAGAQPGGAPPHMAPVRGQEEEDVEEEPTTPRQQQQGKPIAGAVTPGSVLGSAAQALFSPPPGAAAGAASPASPSASSPGITRAVTAASGPARGLATCASPSPAAAGGNRAGGRDAAAAAPSLPPSLSPPRQAILEALSCWRPGRPLHPDQAACVAAFLSHDTGGLPNTGGRGSRSSRGSSNSGGGSSSSGSGSSSRGSAGDGMGSQVLLQGPPGTGKTETLALCVIGWLAARLVEGGPTGPPGQGGVVLLSGPTHTAIDTVMERIAQRIQEGALKEAVAAAATAATAATGAGAPAGSCQRRVHLVRLNNSRTSLAPHLTALGMNSKIPKTFEPGVWYLVAGTLRHLQTAAEQLRQCEAQRACRQGAAAMAAGGRGALASALVLDEASMVFAPQLLALAGLLVEAAALLVAGDHQQLSTILAADLAADLRPNLRRHRPDRSAFDYMRLLASAGSGSGSSGGNSSGAGGSGGNSSGPGSSGDQQQQDPPQWATGFTATPRVRVVALSYTHRLPPAVTALLAPLYARDGVQLVGRRHPHREAVEVVEAEAEGVGAAANRLVVRRHGATGAVVGGGGGGGAGVGPSRAPGSGDRIGPLGTATAIGGGQLLAPPLPQPGRALHTSTTSTSGSSGGSGTSGSSGSSGSGGGVQQLPAQLLKQLWAPGGGEGDDSSGGGGVYLLLHNEDRSQRVNRLEVELVCQLMEASPFARQEQQGHAAAAATAAAAPAAAPGRNAGDAVPAAPRPAVAIITPHRAQRRALRAAAQGRPWGGVCRVETVERMQGDEADTVIFSATVSSCAALEAAAAFYTDLCRANVAFSRTRTRLLVLASRAFLTHMPTSYSHYRGLELWRQLQHMCEVEGRLLGELVGLPGGGGGGGGGGGDSAVSYRCDVFAARSPGQ